MLVIASCVSLHSFMRRPEMHEFFSDGLQHISYWCPFVLGVAYTMPLLAEWVCEMKGGINSRMG